MKKILIIAFNQVRRQLSERGTLITAFIMPVLMMFFIGLFTSDQYSTGIVDVVRSAVPGREIAADDLADKFVALLRAEGQEQIVGKARFIVCDLSRPAEQPEACKLDDLQAGDALAAFAAKRVQDGVTSASVTLPENFGEALRAAQAVSVKVDAKGDPTRTQFYTQAVGTVNARLGGAVLAARVATQRIGGDAAFFEKVYDAAEAVWDKNPVKVREVFSTVTGTSAGSGFGQSAPGIGAMFVMINALALAQVFVTERKNWTMQRLLIMPLARGQILAGKLLGQFLLGLITFSVMIGAGTALGVRWGDPAGVVAVMLAYTLAVTAMALAFSALVRTAGQAGGIGFLIPMILAPIGGGWWPMDIMPQALQTVGRVLSPIAWSQDAFNRMVYYGATLPDILPNLGVLLLYTAAFFVIGMSRFKYE